MSEAAGFGNRNGGRRLVMSCFHPAQPEFFLLRRSGDSAERNVGSFGFDTVSASPVLEVGAVADAHEWPETVVIAHAWREC